MIDPNNIPFLSKLHPDAMGGTNDIVEWNVHFFSSDTRKYPFHPQATYTPDVSRLSKDPLENYLNDLE